MLIVVLADQLEPGPAYYPDGELTEEPEETLMAELIREAALERDSQKGIVISHRGARLKEFGTAPDG